MAGNGTYRKFLPAILFALCGTVFLALPLLRDLHIELAIVASVIGTIYGLVLGRSEQAGLQHGFTRLANLFALGLFPLLNSLFTGCFTPDGIGFWFLFPGFSYFFAYSLSRATRTMPFGLLISIVLLIWFAGGTFLIDFFNNPQVYFHNHVWGGWPGPIYDEEIRVTLPHVIFRGFTLTWIVLFWNIPRFRQSRSKIIIALSLAVLILVGLNKDRLGLESPGHVIAEKLGGRADSEHFTAFFDPEFVDSDEQRLRLLWHEFYLSLIVEKLDVPYPDNIHSFWYTHPWNKRELVGAKYTSFVPVWNQKDQLHVDRVSMDRLLHHELVHVVAKEFGNDVLNASWSIGFVEGLATGIASGRSTRSTLHQLVAASKPWPTAEELENSFSFFGFYAGRSSVNYTTAGSFIDYLMQAYPVDHLKKAYSTGDVEAAYRLGFDSLTAGWHRFLSETEFDSIDAGASRALFSLPSVFEQSCPHRIPPVYARFDQFLKAQAENDTLSMVEHIQEAMDIEPGNTSLFLRWAPLQLALGKPELVVESAYGDSLHPFYHLFRADALMLSGDSTKAVQTRNAASNLVEQGEQFQGFDLYFERRASIRQWDILVKQFYLNQTIDSTTFRTASKHNRLMAFEQAIEAKNTHFIQNNWPVFADTFEFVPEYFSRYLDLAGKMAFQGLFDEADALLAHIEAQSLRTRELELLREMESFCRFVRTS